MLIDEFLKPEIKPNLAFQFNEDVIKFRISQDSEVIQEIYMNMNNYYGFRYQVWVAWRDAGKVVRNHSWLQIEPNKVIVENISEIQIIAEHHSETEKIQFIEGWKKPYNNL